MRQMVRKLREATRILTPEYTPEQRARIEAANAKMREKEARKRVTGSMKPPSRTEGRFASRKALMDFLGAEQANPYWAWCGVDHAERKVYFSMWTYRPQGKIGVKVGLSRLRRSRAYRSQGDCRQRRLLPFLENHQAFQRSRSIGAGINWYLLWRSDKYQFPTLRAEVIQFRLIGCWGDGTRGIGESRAGVRRSCVKLRQRATESTNYQNAKYQKTKEFHSEPISITHNSLQKWCHIFAHMRDGSHQDVRRAKLAVPCGPTNRSPAIGGVVVPLWPRCTASILNSFVYRRFGTPTLFVTHTRLQASSDYKLPDVCGYEAGSRSDPIPAGSRVALVQAYCESRMSPHVLTDAA